MTTDICFCNDEWIIETLERKRLINSGSLVSRVHHFPPLPKTDLHRMHFHACTCGLFLNRSGKSHHKFSLSSFVGVIQHAGRKRSSQGPLGGKLNAAQIDPSRPSSTQSVSTQFGKLICGLYDAYNRIRALLMPLTILKWSMRAIFL